MSTPVNVSDLLRNFSDYINRVAYRGERFVLIRGGKPVAELSGAPAGTRLADLPALLASLPRLDPADAEAFDRDLEAARAETPPMEDRWGS
jgi:antitoxin (DNA-binding transcriptional repressor) of toxin-antitoxin stability system